eukprot:COSAG02_NODE_5575_length_4220_cov_7.527057_1_plen_79_part_00
MFMYPAVILLVHWWSFPKLNCVCVNIIGIPTFCILYSVFCIPDETLMACWLACSMRVQGGRAAHSVATAAVIFIVQYM